uniref:ankyrin repeat and SAM domain-containing protein 3 n=1 Tax=Myxine glutinosa TaxID=7769 RepID=UPI00358E791E
MSETSDESSEGEVPEAWCDLDKAPPLDFHTAASIGDRDVIFDHLHGSGKDMDSDVQNIGGWTALLYASYMGHTDVIDELLKCGAAVNARSPAGLGPLALAASCGNLNTATLLLKKGAEVDFVDYRGWTPLLLCCRLGHDRLTDLLIKHHANLNHREPVYLNTPLMIAARAGHERLVQQLLQQGAIMNGRNTEGDTALMMAKAAGHLSVIKLLEQMKISREQDSSLEKDWDNSNSGGNYCVNRAVSIHDGPRAVANLSSATNTTCGKVDRFQSERQKEGFQAQTPSLSAFLASAGCERYLTMLEGQDVDLQVLLTLTENDLKEIGLKLFGPRRKLVAAIARWHSLAPLPQSDLEQAYADRLEAELQEMAIELQKRSAVVEELEESVRGERTLRSVLEEALAEKEANHAEMIGATRSVLDICHDTTNALQCARTLLLGEHRAEERRLQEKPCRDEEELLTHIDAKFTEMVHKLQLIMCKKDNSKRVRKGEEDSN